MRVLAISILTILFVTGHGFACSNPMSQSQLRKVNAEFDSMTPGGDGFKIDRCRNIRIRYGDDQKVGKLHQLFTELNHSHHDTTYLGLIDDGEWWVYGSGGGIYIYHPDKTKPQSADWMIEKNAQIVQLLKLAGYENDPRASKRAEILKRDLEELGTPDFGESVGSLLGILERHAPTVDQSNNSRQCSGQRQVCISQCASLPRGKGVYAGFGPAERCEKQCRSITCQ